MSWHLLYDINIIIFIDIMLKVCILTSQELPEVFWGAI